MRGETRKFGDRTSVVILLESESESKMIDQLGSEVKDGDGFIASGIYEIRLADGYGEHYVVLKDGLASTSDNYHHLYEFINEKGLLEEFKQWLSGPMPTEVEK